MKYLILIYSNPRSRAAWDKLTEQQQRKFGQDHYDLSDKLRASGELIVSEGLPGPETGKGVSIRDGQVVVTDGPFAEAKEYLGGLTILDAPDLDAALEWGRKAARAVGLPIEVRPFQWA